MRNKFLIILSVFLTVLSASCSSTARELELIKTDDYWDGGSVSVLYKDRFGKDIKLNRPFDHELNDHKAVLIGAYEPNKGRILAKDSEQFLQIKKDLMTLIEKAKKGSHQWDHLLIAQKYFK